MARALQYQEGRTTLLLKEGSPCPDSRDETHNFVTIVDQVKAMCLIKAPACIWLFGPVVQQQRLPKLFLTPRGHSLP